jgi:hypothetical protein
MFYIFLSLPPLAVALGLAVGKILHRLSSDAAKIAIYMLASTIFGIGVIGTCIEAILAVMYGIVYLSLRFDQSGGLEDFLYAHNSLVVTGLVALLAGFVGWDLHGAYDKILQRNGG